MKPRRVLVRVLDPTLIGFEAMDELTTLGRTLECAGYVECTPAFSLYESDWEPGPQARPFHELCWCFNRTKLLESTVVVTDEPEDVYWERRAIQVAEEHEALERIERDKLTRPPPIDLYEDDD